MKQIELKGKNGSGVFCLVDDDDYESLSKKSWYIKKNTQCTDYARANFKQSDGTFKSILMHRVIMCVTDPEIKIDHKDGNGLNNQKNNLRFSTTSQNAMNKKAKITSTSQYLGVSICSVQGGRYKYWQVSIKAEGKCKALGTFPYTDEGEILAAKRYDEKAKEYFGEFANLNFQ